MKSCIVYKVLPSRSTGSDSGSLPTLWLCQNLRSVLKMSQTARFSVDFAQSHGFSE